jgi:hypothetical protein
MRRPLWFFLLAAFPLACTSTEQDPSSGVIFEKGGAAGASNGGTSGVSGSGQSGHAGTGAGGSGEGGTTPAGGNGGSGPAGSGGSTAGSGNAGSGQSGNGQAGSGNAGGQAGSGNAGSGNAGSGQGGQGQAGSGQAGSGQAGMGQAGNGQAGSGPAGSGGTPTVHIVAPADGSTVDNPVAISLEAQDVDSVGLVADDKYSLPLDGWQVSTASSYDLSYTFSSTGMRTLTLSGYLTGVSTPAATDTITLTIPTPPPALCDGVAQASFEPPTSCNGPSGQTSKQIPDNGVFSTSWFGCYRKADGTIYKDPSDNCEFACGDKGLCGGNQGPSCEADLKWFAADADRFGCGAHIRVTNCVNNLSVVLATLDRGPNCGSVEQPDGAPVLDMSHDAMVYLFEGKTYGGDDHKRVVIEKVDPSVPLGPGN